MPCIADRASIRRRRPAPENVRHRWAVKSVRQVTVVSLRVRTFLAFFFLPLTVATSLWTPIRCSFCGVITAFQRPLRLDLSLRPSSL